ncbi:MAG: sulfatase, partial [Nocardioides sp.]|nr:sulfatase [Nocardioides sp.]
MGPRARLATAAVAVLAGSSLLIGAKPLAAVSDKAFARAGAASTQTPIPPIVPAAVTPQPAWKPYATKPNILMITADDMAEGDLQYMPHVRQLLEAQGTNLTAAIAPTPICVPARASLVTGQYAVNNNARTISGPHGGYAALDESNTVPIAMQKAGYDTLFTGKYLNGYGEHGTSKDVPPGWTDWRATTDPSTYNFMNPRINHNGTLTKYHRYSTYVMRDQVNAMLQDPKRKQQPWFMWANYVAPHHGAPIENDDPMRVFKDDKHARIGTTVPAPEDKGKYAAVPLPSLPYMFRTPVDAPQNSPSQHHFDTETREALRIAYDQRLESLQAVDRAVESHVELLQRTGQLDNTIIIFASDNGYTTGGHNINGKLMFYQEMQQIPVIIRGPGIPVNKTVATTVTNPDIATTIMAAGGAKPLRRQDGVNILPWLSLPTQYRPIPIAGWQVGNGDKQIYHGIRYGDWTYIRLANGTEELYNRATDPYQIRSLQLLPAYQKQLHE